MTVPKLALVIDDSQQSTPQWPHTPASRAGNLPPQPHLRALTARLAAPTPLNSPKPKPASRPAAEFPVLRAKLVAVAPPPTTTSFSLAHRLAV